MARIDVDDDFWVIIEILTRLLGNEDQAISQAMRIKRLAQQRYKNGRVITKSEFQALGFSPKLIGVIVEPVDENSYMTIGAEKEFGWLRERIESGRRGGIESGKSRSSDSNELARSKREANRSKPKQTEPSYSSSPSLLQETTRTKGTQMNLVPLDSEVIKAPENKKSKSDKKSLATAAFIGVYVQAFQKRFPRSRPELGSKVQGQIRRFVAERPPAEAERLIRAYFGMRDKWFMEKGYDFTTFLENLQKIGIHADNQNAPPISAPPSEGNYRDGPLDPKIKELIKTVTKRL